MRGDEDDINQCNNKNCKFVWFHQKSVRINQVPEGNWYCFESKRLNWSRKKH